jgi:hypothetical protein
MASVNLSWQEYEWQRRSLSARLSLCILAMIPVPSLLLAMHVPSVWMLLTMLCNAEGVSVVCPLAWRPLRSPDRHRAQERWAVCVAFACKSVAAFSTTAAAVVWATLVEKSSTVTRAVWVIVLTTAALAWLLFVFYSEGKTRRALRRPFRDMNSYHNDPNDRHFVQLGKGEL